MPICPICDDTGLQNSDSNDPEFCYCYAGKRARRQWEEGRGGGQTTGSQPGSGSFIDIANLEDVNARVDALRASLFGTTAGEETAPAAKHPALLLLYSVAHAGHEVSITEATQLFELAKALEGFLNTLAPIGKNLKR